MQIGSSLVGLRDDPRARALARVNEPLPPKDVVGADNGSASDGEQPGQFPLRRKPGANRESFRADVFAQRSREVSVVDPAGAAPPGDERRQPLARALVSGACHFMSYGTKPRPDFPARPASGRGVAMAQASASAAWQVRTSRGHICLRITEGCREWSAARALDTV